MKTQTVIETIRLIEHSMFDAHSKATAKWHVQAFYDEGLDEMFNNVVTKIRKLIATNQRRYV